MRDVAFEVPASSTKLESAVEEEPRLSLFKANRILLVATLFAAPLPFGAVQQWAWTSLLLLMLVSSVLWALGMARERVIRLVWSPLYISLTLFALLAATQYWGHMSADRFSTREALLKLIMGFICFFLAGQLFTARSGTSLVKLGFAVVLYTSLLSLFAVLQFLAANGFIYWVVKPRWGGWIFGPYVNHNHYAGLIEMLIPVCAAYVLSRGKGNPGRSLLVFAVLVPVASLLLSGSRGGIIALLVEILVAAAILHRRSSSPRFRSAMPIAALGFLGAMLLFFWLDPGNILPRLESAASFSQTPEVTLGNRLTVLRDSLGIFRDHRWLGAGLGSFEVVFPQYRSFASDLIWDHAHNDYAEALAETGMAGGALILGAIALFFGTAFRGLSQRLTTEAGWIQVGAAVGCCGLLVHSLVDFNLHIPANALWFALCAGIATTTPASSRRVLDGRT